MKKKMESRDQTGASCHTPREARPIGVSQRQRMGGNQVVCNDKVNIRIHERIRLLC